MDIYINNLLFIMQILLTVIKNNNILYRYLNDNLYNREA